MSLLDTALAPFTIALMLMALFGLLELIGAMFGASLSDLIDDALPDTEAADVADAPDADGNFAGDIFAWLSIGKAPLLMLIIIFLTAFGVSGILIQNLANAVFGAPLFVPLAALAAFVLGVLAMRQGGLLIARLIPREQTDAVSLDTFIGRVATIIRGEARGGLPAEAKLQDALGQTHYVLVEPDVAGDVFAAGREVLLVSRHGAVFRVIANRHASLSPAQT